MALQGRARLQPEPQDPPLLGWKSPLCELPLAAEARNPPVLGLGLGLEDTHPIHTRRRRPSVGSQVGGGPWPPRARAATGTPAGGLPWDRPGDLAARGSLPACSRLRFPVRLWPASGPSDRARGQRPVPGTGWADRTSRLRAAPALCRQRRGRRLPAEALAACAGPLRGRAPGRRATRAERGGAGGISTAMRRNGTHVRCAGKRGHAMRCGPSAFVRRAGGR
jgi:hypothetical protein